MHLAAVYALKGENTKPGIFARCGDLGHCRVVVWLLAALHGVEKNSLKNSQNESLHLYLQLDLNACMRNHAAITNTLETSRCIVQFEA